MCVLGASFRPCFAARLKSSSMKADTSALESKGTASVRAVPGVVESTMATMNRCMAAAGGGGRPAMVDFRKVDLCASGRVAGV